MLNIGLEHHKRHHKKSKGPKRIYSSVEVVKLIITRCIRLLCPEFSGFNFNFFVSLFRFRFGFCFFGASRHGAAGATPVTLPFKQVAAIIWVPYHSNFFFYIFIFPFTFSNLFPKVPLYCFGGCSSLPFYSLLTPQTVQPFFYVSILTYANRKYHNFPTTL